MKIEQAEQVLFKAILNSDCDQLETLLADDLIFTSQAGLVMGKNEDLEAHRSGILKILELVPSESTIREYGSTAIVNVRVALKGTYDTHPFSGNFRYTRVWLKQNDQWKIVAAHVSQIV